MAVANKAVVDGVSRVEDFHSHVVHLDDEGIRRALSGNRSEPDAPYLRWWAVYDKVVLVFLHVGPSINDAVTRPIDG